VGPDDPTGVGGDRRDQHDPPVTALGHPGQQPPRHQERRAQVHRVQAVPVLDRDRLDRAGSCHHAGVGHQDVDRAELRLDRLAHRVRRVRLGQVRGHGARAAPRAAQLGHDRVCLGARRATADPHVVTVGRERQRDRPADAARCSADECGGHRTQRNG
jgi:hypothetical protein